MLTPLVALSDEGRESRRILGHGTILTCTVQGVCKRCLRCIRQGTMGHGKTRHCFLLFIRSLLAARQISHVPPSTDISRNCLPPSPRPGENVRPKCRPQACNASILTLSASTNIASRDWTGLQVLGTSSTRAARVLMTLCAWQHGYLSRRRSLPLRWPLDTAKSPAQTLCDVQWSESLRGVELTPATPRTDGL
jgi:hypothetical protein